MQAVPDTTAQTQAVLAHHLQALTLKDLEATLADYSEQTILFTQNGVLTGLDQLLTPEFMAELQFARQDIQGEYAYLAWSSGSTVPIGTDTFVIRDGKIVTQTFTVYMRR
jgi:hypothetical protein